MAQRSVRKMLNRQAKLTGRPATAKARGLGTSKANAAVRKKTGTSRSGPLGGSALKTTPKRRILPGVVQKSPLRSTPARKILPGVVQKPKNKQRSVASMRATQRRLRKG